MGLRCKLRIHAGNMVPQHEIAEEIDGRSAFVCSRCGAVIE